MVVKVVARTIVVGDKGKVRESWDLCSGCTFALCFPGNEIQKGVLSAFAGTCGLAPGRCTGRRRVSVLAGKRGLFSRVVICQMTKECIEFHSNFYIFPHSRSTSRSIFLFLPYHGQRKNCTLFILLLFLFLLPQSYTSVQMT